MIKKRLCAVAMSMMMAASLVPNVANATTGNSVNTTIGNSVTAGQSVRTDDIQTAKDKNGKEYYTKIKINPFTYTDIGGGAKATLDQKVLTNLVKNNLLDDWAEIANGCFIDAKSSASMDYNYEKKFNTNTSYDCFKDIRPYLKDKSSAKSYGKVSRDSLHKSGLKVVNNLNDIRGEVARDIVKQIDHKSLSSTDGILSQGPKDDKGDRHALYEMFKIGKQQKENKTNSPVIYNFVTSISEKDFKYSNRYAYNTFGIAFYDFTPRAIQADDLTYKSATEGYETAEEAKTKGAPGFTYNTEKTNPRAFLEKNEGSSTTERQISSGYTETFSMTNNTSKSSSYSFGQNIGANAGWEAKTPFGAAKAGISYGFNFSESFQKTEGKSDTITTSKPQTFNTRTTLPGHTAATITSYDNDTNITEDYDTPTAISYKVCIFALTGTVYADDAACCDFSCYDHGSYTNIIGADSTFGISAPENLYHRAVTNYEGSSRTDDEKSGAPIEKWTDTKSGAGNLGVDWKSSYFVKGDGKSALDRQKTTIPMLSCGCEYKVKYQSTTHTVGEATPLYLPNRFSVKGKGSQGECHITEGSRFNIGGQYDIECFDRGGVPYAAFDEKDGEWILCDSEGNELAGSDVIGISVDGIGHEIITGKKEGIAYVTWDLKKNVHYKSVEPGEIVRGCKSVIRPILMITVDGKEFKGNLKVDGEFKGCVGDKDMNLNRIFTVTAEDETGKQVNVPITWDAKELNGITVTEGGDISFTQEGTYHVRAVVRNTTGTSVYSDWIEIQAGAPRVIDRVEFAQTNDPIIVCNQGEKNYSNNFDLASYVNVYDQYGEIWNGDDVILNFELTGNTQNATIEDGILKVRGEGNVGVKVTDIGHAITNSFFGSADNNTSACGTFAVGSDTVVVH